MEFLSVGGIKLKVTLSPEECEAFGIEHKEEGEGSQISRESVKKILAEARERVRFLTAGERLLIQIYPLGKEGTELFVTKLSAIPERERRAVAESGILTYMGRFAYYKIPDTKSLFAVAKILGARAVTLYLGGDGEYYISLEEALLGEISDCDVLCEFGEKLHRLPLGISTEWGSRLSSDAPLLNYTGK